MTANHLLGTWNRYEIKKYNNRVITTFGYGDGGGGPTREMLEKEKRYRYGLPTLGKTHLTTLKDSLKVIEDNFNKSCKKFGKTPTWDDELYLEYHRGTYTSVPRIKKYNRDLEFSFLNTELIASLDAIINHHQYPKDIINDNYETFLLHQFHDILPGSAIAKVYQDADRYLGNIKKDNKAIINENLNGLLRQYYIKGSSFDWISDEIAFSIQSRLNNRPRKRLGYLSPVQKFLRIFANKKHLVKFLSLSHL